jgi:hypothetical protein
VLWIVETEAKYGFLKSEEVLWNERYEGFAEVANEDGKAARRAGS